MPPPVTNNSKDATTLPATGASSSPSPPPASTVASAGKHNSYIWTKADYFFGKDGSTSNAAAGASVRPSKLHYYTRASLFALFMANVSLALVNFVMLPIQALAFGWVMVGVIRQSNSRNVVAGAEEAATAGGRASYLARWSPLAMRACELLVAWWQEMLSALLEHAFGMRVVLSGDVLPDSVRGEGALLLSNHPSTADWVYLWSWLSRQGDLSRLKIVLKGSLHGVPVIGWALQCVRYLFLARQWERDQKHMEEVVQHWAGMECAGAGSEESSGPSTVSASVASASSTSSSSSFTPDPVQLLLFPEGTDLRPVSFDQSAAFVARASDTGAITKLQPMQHLLQPRTTGFVHLVKLLRKTGSIKAVYDLTSVGLQSARSQNGQTSLGSTPVPVTIENLARGVVPDEFHVHVRRYALESLPQGDEQLAAWIQARWGEKDRLLEGFYGSTPRGFDRSAEQERAEAARLRSLQFRHFSLLAAFALLCILHAIAFVSSPLWVTLYHAASIGLWTHVTRKFGGFDTLMLNVDHTHAREQEEARRKHGKKAQ